VKYDDRLHHALRLAEERFGKRVYADAIPLITFHAGPPQVFFPTPSTVAIRLSSRCESDYLLGCYHLAHETVHLLSPVPRREITTLEEGLAVLFARDYIRSNIDIEFPLPTHDRYNHALSLVERFLSPRPDAILRLREHEPVISNITADLIHRNYPEIPMSLCWPLVAPFYSLSET
jgi:hypothetical protein